MPILETEQIEQTQEFTPPEFPRYFAPSPRVEITDNLTGVIVVVVRFDAADSHARYYEGGAWSEPCDCGNCTLGNAIEYVQRNIYIELTPAEALMRIGGAK